MPILRLNKAEYLILLLLRKSLINKISYSLRLNTHIAEYK